jgi:hypothetical protein
MKSVAMARGDVNAQPSLAMGEPRNSCYVLPARPAAIPAGVGVDSMQLTNLNASVAPVLGSAQHLAVHDGIFGGRAMVEMSREEVS